MPATIIGLGGAIEAEVATSQSVTSATYTDLGTVGPSVTMVTGQAALVLVQAKVSDATIAKSCFVGVDVSGATTIAAADNGLQFDSSVANAPFMGCAFVYFGSLTQGSNVFTLKYRTDAGAGTWSMRKILVIPL